MEQNNQDTILIGSDHAGYELKEAVKAHLRKIGVPFEDSGADRIDPQDDYPIFATRVAKQISQKKFSRGIVICGTGIGASIAANRWRGVRAALCWTPEVAKLSRNHNDANVLVLGGRTTPAEIAMDIVDAWLESRYEGGRHARRVQQLDDLSAC
jgi:RpiB/LacA/LacB family sugar-phosphate isomerase